MKFSDFIKKNNIVSEAKEFYRLESKNGLNAVYDLKQLATTMQSRLEYGNDFDINWLKWIEKYVSIIKKEIVHNKAVAESKESEDFSRYIRELAQELHKEKSKYSPDAVSMYREKIKSLGRKLGFDNREIDQKIEAAYQSYKK
jgi:MinD-like ATPase involved in chromosome partitioning or flagellar assembly